MGDLFFVLLGGGEELFLWLGTPSQKRYPIDT